MQREQLSGQQHPEFKLEPSQRSRGADATRDAQAGRGQRPALNEKSLRLKLESGVLPSLPSSSSTAAISATASNSESGHTVQGERQEMSQLQRLTST